VQGINAIGTSPDPHDKALAPTRSDSFSPANLITQEDMT
jgi:hypothetical protein